MARRCGTKNGKSKCHKPRADWWKSAMGINWYDSTGSSGGGAVYSPEYQAVLTEAGISLNGLPSVPQRVAEDQVIVALKDAGIWDLTDSMHVLLTDGSFNFAKIDLKLPSRKGTTALNPVFTQNNGIKPTGTGSYYNPNWAPSDGVNYQLNSGEHIVYYKDIVTGTGTDGARNVDGTRQSFLQPSTASNTANGRINSNGSVTVNNAQFDTAEGLYFFGAINSTTGFVRKGSGSRVTFSDTRAAGLTANKFVLGGLNQNTPESVILPNTRRQLLFWSGGLLTTDQEDAFKAAWDTYMTAVGSPPAPATLGTLFTRTSFPNTTDFTNNGSTVIINADKLEFSGGSGAFTQTLDLSTYGGFSSRSTCLEKWKVTGVFPVVSLTGFGFGIGLRSNNTQDKINATAWFSLTQGRLFVSTGTANTVVSNPATVVTFSAADRIEVTLERDGDMLIGTVRNLTTGSALVTGTYQYTSTAPYTPNTGRFCIYSFGGTFQCDEFTVTSNAPKNQKLLIVGDSKTNRYFASNWGLRFARLINDNYNGVVVNAGGSDKIGEALSRVQEIIDMQPTTVLLIIGSNDPRFGVPSATYLPQYDSLDSQLTGAGIRVIHSTGLYETSGVDQTPLQTHILATKNSANIWDSLGQVLGLSDAVHPNDAGHATATSNFIATQLIT